MNTDKIIVGIEQLYLDPNNYRFVDSVDYQEIKDTDIMLEKVQIHTMRLLLGKKTENIQDLIVSFKNNGYLSLEPLQVRTLGEDKYLVIEGNRRVATLKYLYEQYKSGIRVGKLNKEDFDQIEVQDYNAENNVPYLIAMGLHHITGKKRWNPLNQARLVCDLLDKYQMPEEQIAQSLGCTIQAIRKSKRAISLIEIYKQSDFGDYFESNMFSFFEEVMKSPSMKCWLEWSDLENTCKNKLNQDRFFSWISPEEVESEPSDSSIGFAEMMDPIIIKSAEIRTLAKFINDEEALKVLETKRSVADAYSYSSVVRKERLNYSLNNIQSDLSFLLSSYNELNEEGKKLIHELSNKFGNFISYGKMSPVSDVNSYFPQCDSHFTSIKISDFRGLSNLELAHLNRMNLFVGDNNTGKTSLLESIFLLCNFNCIERFVDIETIRGKTGDTYSKEWLLSNLQRTCELSGMFQGTECYVKTEIKDSDDLNLDRQGYLKTLECESVIGQDKYTYKSKIDMYFDKPDKVYYNKKFVLCPSAFTTPYRRNRKWLVEMHRKVVQEGQYEKLLSFIRAHFDDTIDNISLVQQGDESRFIVKSSSYQDGLDLTKYGEGLQRVFEIGLYLIYCSNGCLMIDEIDSAIHTSLIGDFLKFIQSLSKEFNVQLFITTHSKESVDTFFSIAESEHTSVYRLKKEEDRVIAFYSNGSAVKSIIDNSGADIR